MQITIDSIEPSEAGSIAPECGAPAMPPHETGQAPATNPRRGGAQLRWLIVLGGLDLSALLLDRVAAVLHFELAATLRLAVVLPLVLGGIALCLRGASMRLQSVAAAAATVALATVVTAIGQFAPEPFATRYMMAAQFLIFGSPLFAALPWRATWIMTVAATAAFSVIVGSGLRFPPAGANLDLVMFCIVTAGLALSLRRRKDRQLAEIFDMRRIDWSRASELRKANHSLSVLSHTDPLTGVFNRRYLDEIIDRLAASIAPNAGYGVLMIDVDRFKLLNDCGGHPEGDRCLRLIASAIQRGLRSSDDTVVRYGGEEFTVVLPDADLGETLAVAERLRSAVADLRFQHPGLEPGNFVSVSIGAYAASLDEPMTDALHRADAALYNAKRSGRNRVAASASMT
jgi:diguanylate cyclase (GGDEF)-like protein